MEVQARTGYAQNAHHRFADGRVKTPRAGGPAGTSPSRLVHDTDRTSRGRHGGQTAQSTILNIFRPGGPYTIYGRHWRGEIQDLSCRRDVTAKRGKTHIRCSCDQPWTRRWKSGLTAASAIHTVDTPGAAPTSRPKNDFFFKALATISRSIFDSRAHPYVTRTRRDLTEISMRDTEQPLTNKHAVEGAVE